ncbi:hypothetical protein ACH4PU_30640 [Streptomyces sp. NPDC021100]|uniref:hypothetical protein n=1 Tax=Streptomyces sp. NPDC021100 TaxID=3365114 RepID=UPI0037B7A56D
MTDLAFLEREIGGQALGVFLTAAVRSAMDLDHMPEHRAYQWVTDRADAGDPLIIAAPGQVWTRRADTDPEEAPIRRLFINERLTAPAAVYVTYLDVNDSGSDLNDGADVPPSAVGLHDARKGDEFLIDFLDLYELESWRTVETLLPTPAEAKADTP